MPNGLYSKSPEHLLVVKNIGWRSCRQLGDRVHLHVRRNFPIAIYGRLNPYERAFGLDCARRNSCLIVLPVSIFLIFIVYAGSDSLC
jgi:hypothetical protein